MTDAIKSAAGRPCGQESVTEQNLAQLSRVRLLLSFYEMLEKLMYNAFDGCSVALPLAPKVRGGRLTSIFPVLF